MVIDLTPAAAAVDQFAATLDQFVAFLDQCVVPPLLAVLCLVFLYALWKLKRKAEQIGVSLDALIGAHLLIEGADDLTPEEALKMVKAARRDA